MIVLICTRKHTTIPYKAASKFLDQRKGREGNEERGGGGGGGAVRRGNGEGGGGECCEMGKWRGGGSLFVEEMERGEGEKVVKWGN